jgi:hypothetical protein
VVDVEVDAVDEALGFDLFLRDPRFSGCHQC